MSKECKHINKDGKEVILSIYKMDDYSCYCTPWDLEKTIKWYKDEYGEECDEDWCEDVDLDTEGMYWETESEEDKLKIGDTEEYRVEQKVILEGIEYKRATFGSLMYHEGMLNKLIPYREVLETHFKDEDITEPFMISTTEW